MDPSRLPGYFYNCFFILGIISLQSSYHCNSLRMCFCILNFPSACGDQLYLLFLAVQNSSTGDLVTQSVSHSLVTCETFDQSYEKTWSDLPTYLTTCLSNYLPTWSWCGGCVQILIEGGVVYRPACKYLLMHLSGAPPRWSDCAIGLRKLCELCWYPFHSFHRTHFIPQVFLQPSWFWFHPLKRKVEILLCPILWRSISITTTPNTHHQKPTPNVNTMASQWSPSLLSTSSLSWSTPASSSQSPSINMASFSVVLYNIIIIAMHALSPYTAISIATISLSISKHFLQLKTFKI